MTFFVHPSGICETQTIGAGSRVWAFAHVLPGASIGRDCNICDHVFIENDVQIGDRVTIKSGVQLWDGTRIADDVFIGPNATFTNDRYPRSKHYPDAFLQTQIATGASIGANATILPGLQIGRHAMIGAGAVVTRSVPPFAIVVGNPGRIVGYTTSSSAVAPESSTPLHASTFPVAIGRADSVVRGVGLYRIREARDLRGNLSAAEVGVDIPFEVQRYFLVFGVPSAETRGEHAHRACHQFLVCVHGSCSVVVDDGDQRQEYLLDRPGLAIHLPPMVWGIQYKYSPGSVLMVLASHHYDSDDYIRDYDEFLVALGRGKSAP